MTEKTELLKRWGVTTAETYPELWSEDDEKLYQSILDDAHQPVFAVGEYYTDEFFVYKILEIAKTEEVGVWDTKLNALELSTGKIITNTKWFINEKSGDKPATSEQIAKFKRAELFASKGRKLDEFKGWDTVAFNGVGKTVIGTNDDCVVLCDTAIKKNNPELILIQTAEELQEVENNE